MITSEQSDSRKYGTWCIAALVWLLPVVLFWPTVGADFVQWDDDINIYGNPHLRQNGIASLFWAFTDLDYVRRYMPLGWVSWIVNFQLDGISPTSYHLGNVLVHGANSLLVYFLTWSILQMALPKAVVQKNELRIRWGAAIGALCWAVHPLRVEVVAWASGRLYGQAAFFLLVSLLSYLHYGASRQKARPRYSWYLAALFFFASSLLTYPLALTALLGFVCLDIFPLRILPVSPRGWCSQNACKTWIEKIPFAFVSLSILGITFWARTHVSEDWKSVASLDSFGVFHRFMQSFYVWAIYLVRCVAPFELSPLYTTLVDFNPNTPIFWGCLIIILVLTVLALWWGRRWLALPISWISYLVLLVPMLGLMEHPHYASDRYSYIATLPLFIGLAGILVWLTTSQVHRRGATFITTVSAAVVVAWMGMARVQSNYWRDTPTLFNYMITCLDHKSPTFDLYHRLGNYYMTVGRFEEAAQAFQKEMSLFPDLPRSWRQLGNARACQGRFDEATVAYRRLLEISPRSPGAMAFLGLALLELKHFDEAIPYLDQASAEENANVWQLHLALGRCWFAKNDFNKSLTHLNEALSNQPHEVLASIYKSKCLQALDQMDEAFDVLKESWRINPNSSELAVNLVKLMSKAQRINDSSLGISSLQLVRKVQSQLGKEDALSLEALAFLYAGESRYEEAIGTLQKAMNLAKQESTRVSMAAQLEAWAVRRINVPQKRIAEDAL